MFHNKNDALFKAAKKGDVAAIEKAIQDGADLNARHFWGFNETALHIAAKHDQANAIDVLIRLGIDVNTKDRDKRTALDWAAIHNRAAAIDALVRHGADVQARDDGLTALYFAAASGGVEAIDALVHHGLDVNAKSKDGRTPLHSAAALNGRIDVIDALVRYGADVHAKDNNGITPAVTAKTQKAVAKLKAYEKEYPPGPRISDTASLLSRLKPSIPSTASIASESSAKVTTASSTPGHKVLPKAPIGQVSARYPYTASDETELTVVQGQLVNLIEKQVSGWWLCELNGKRGLVPGNYLQEMVDSKTPTMDAADPSPGVRTTVTPSATSTPSHSSAAASSSSSTHGSHESEALSLTDNKDFDQWVIPYSDLTLGKRLGRGSFGEVHLATYVHEPVAVKTLYVGETAKVLEDFKREVLVMTHLKSMYIVQLRAVTIKPYSMVMEYLPKGSLTQLLHNPSEPLPWSQRHQLASDIAKGLAFLHHHQVFHRDLKSDNVLLTETYQAKLSDFGLSKIKAAGSQQSSLTGGSVGTLCWMAPEVMDEDDKSPYRAASDVYSYGMIVWELMTRRVPYEGLSAKQLYVKVVIKGQRELIPEEAPWVFQDMTSKAWAQTPEERPSADEIVKQLAANPIEPSLESQVAVSLAPNTTSIYGQRLGSSLGVSGVGLVPNTASFPPRTSSNSDPRRISYPPSRPGFTATASRPLLAPPSAASSSSNQARGPGLWSNLASLAPGSRTSVPPTLPRSIKGP